MLTTRLLTGTAAVTWWAMSLHPHPDDAGNKFLRNAASIYHTARLTALHILRPGAPTDLTISSSTSACYFMLPPHHICHTHKT